MTSTPEQGLQRRRERETRKKCPCQRLYLARWNDDDDDDGDDGDGDDGGGDGGDGDDGDHIKKCPWQRL